MSNDPEHPRVPPDPHPFQILALDGGGVKALFTAHVLARLEQDLDVRVADSFDLIAGTSAGGIIALALGAGLRPSEIVEHYATLTTRVFPASRRSRTRLAARAFSPTYSSKVLRESLEEVLGTRLLGDSASRLVIPSWDVQRGEVHLFKTPHHQRLNRDWRIPMVDVAMATSAAPTYFSAAHVDGLRLVDGGVWANNPSVVAIGEAVSMLDVPLEAIRVLNIGTVDQRTLHGERLDTGGWANWATSVISLLTTAPGRGAQGTAAHLIGKDDYFRFDAPVPGEVFTLDRASPTALAGLAAGASRVLSPTYAETFATHRAAPYTPHPRSVAPAVTQTTPGGTP